MEIEKLKKEFKQFLKENDALSKYMFNLYEGYSGGYCYIYSERDFDSFMSEKPEYAWLGSAFVFSRTPDGSEYWYKLNKKWIERLESLETKQKDSAYVEIRDSDIATVEALHDLLLDNGYTLNHPTLKRARLLTQKMYMAFKHWRYTTCYVHDLDNPYDNVDLT